MSEYGRLARPGSSWVRVNVRWRRVRTSARSQLGERRAACATTAGSYRVAPENRPAALVQGCPGTTCHHGHQDFGCPMKCAANDGTENDFAPAIQSHHG